MQPKPTPVSVLQHDGVVHVMLRTFGREPTFDAVGSFEEAVLAEQLLSFYAIGDGLKGDAFVKLSITVGDYTVTALRSEYAQVAIVLVTGHPIIKSVQRMMKRLVKAPEGWAPAANDAPDDEPRGLEVVR